MAATRVVEGIWKRDPTVWGGTGGTPELLDRLGWLDIAERFLKTHDDLTDFADSVRADCEKVVLCGMGGSSLAPEVFWRTFQGRPDYPTFVTLDSTTPAAVRQAVHPDEKALFIISSKSGSTIETTSFLNYFWQFTNEDPSRFVAITDKGSGLHDLATARKFRRVFDGDLEIGGRFSALSPFGMVPAALIGVDLEAIVAGAQAAMEDCRETASADNPGAWLGAVFAEAAMAGRDKLTLVLSPALASFGLWAEQLVAEGTGKDHKGLLPVVDEGTASIDSYGRDRLFLSLGVSGDWDPDIEQRLLDLSERGHPVLRLSIPNTEDLGGEFFRWEFATAVAGTILGINVFNQPSVGESKTNTQEVLDSSAELPAIDTPSRTELGRFLTGVKSGDYVAVQAYVTPSLTHDAALAAIARVLQERTGAAVTVGYGPRYLHSTGQFHKGGPPKGHFIQIVETPEEDLAIPETDYTFGQLARAQAEGDARALIARGRPLLLVPGVEELVGLVEGQ
jgi:glucose-6-phosphate isomerase